MEETKIQKSDLEMILDLQDESDCYKNMLGFIFGSFLVYDNSSKSMFTRSECHDILVECVYSKLDELKEKVYGEKSKSDESTGL